MNEIKDIFEIEVPKKRLISVSILIYSGGFLGAWIFYKLLIVSVIFAFVSLASLKIYKKKYREKVHERIESEFYDINLLLSAELETGLPINMAIEMIRKEISHSEIYGFQYMDIELKNWSKKMNMGMKINTIIEDFAKRSQNKSIMEYANMISICTKKGGSIRDVIKNTNAILNEKRELKREIEVLTAEKSLEQKIMNLMPLAVLVLLDKTASDFIAPLYNCLIGRITMTILIAIFLICYLWSAKIASLK